MLFTNSFKILTDGLSTHYWERIASVIFSELNGLTFIYTPLQGMGHNYTNKPNYLKKIEKLMNLIDHFPINTDIEFHRKCPESCMFFFENVPYCCQSKAFAKVKELFYEGKRKESYFSDKHRNIAIHIRKCNAHDYEPPTELSDLRYYNIVQTLRNYFQGESLKFHIYSQGPLEQFQRFWTEPDIELHINESVEDTFSAMVFADVLVTCQSGYSRLAGYLSNGMIIYPREVATPENILPHFKLI